MNPIPFIIQGANIILVVNTKPYTISESHLAYDRIKNAIKNKDWDVIPDLVETTVAIEKYVGSNFEIRDGVFYRDGEVMRGVIADRIVTMFAEGFDVEPMLQFLENLSQNPSKRAVDELYGFLERAVLPITDDGCFLAYKKVRKDYYDVYSGTVLNKPANLLTSDEVKMMPYTKKDVTVEIVNSATTISMPRNTVDDDASNTCSQGLHFCSIDYLKHIWGERVVILKINPKDVVSIPIDYNLTKGRCSSYEIIGEVSDVNSPQKFFDNTTVHQTKQTGYRKNSRGQWIDEHGKFLAKHLIPRE